MERRNFWRVVQALFLMKEWFGEKLFWKALRTFLHRFAWGLAATEDLRRIFEEITQKGLQAFFQEWF